MRSHLESRPLAAFTAAFLAGIAAGPYGLLVTILPILVLSRRTALYLTLLCGALLGWLRAIPADLPDITPGKTVLHGIVTEEPILHSPNRKDLNDIERGEAPSRITFPLQTESGLIRVSRTGPTSSIHRGDVVDIEGYLSAPRPPTNPGQPDHALRLRRQGVSGTLRSYEQQACTVTTGSHPFRWIDGLRNRLRSRLYRSCSSDTAGLLSALVLGYRDGLPEDLVTALQRGGTAHVLSISGAHLAFVYALLHFLTLPFGLSRPRQAMLLLATLLGYTLLTGLDIAVVRAFVMIALFLIAAALRRQPDPITSLSAAALILCLIDPSALFEPSFQLSFAAVLGIFWIGPVFTDFLGKPLRLSGLFSVSASAWLATAPIVQATFNLVTPLIIVANLVVWPIIATLIALGLLVAFIPSDSVGALVGGGCDLLVEILRVLTVRSTESLKPFSYFYSPAPSALLIVIYYLALGLWTFWSRRRPSTIRALLSLPLAALLSLPLLHRERVEHLHVAQLDVGRGLCTYVEFPDGRNFVFDVGSLDYRDPGAAVLAPYLWNRGVMNIDTLFISHSDADHLNGLRGIVERFRVGRIVTTPYVPARLLPGDVPIERVRVEGGQPVPLFSEVVLLSPPVWEETGRSVPANETSLVIRVGDRILLTGDIQNIAAQRLLDRPWDLTAAILAAPHHGKEFSFDEAMAERTGALLLLVSAPVGYSSGRVLQNFPGHVLLTGTSGAIEVECSEPLKVKTFR